MHCRRCNQFSCEKVYIAFITFPGCGDNCAKFVLVAMVNFSSATYNRHSGCKNGKIEFRGFNSGNEFHANFAHEPNHRRQIPA